MRYARPVREWVPVPGSVKARLVEAAIHHFEREGYESASVTELAAKAGVTTGALYHHFGSKFELYALVRSDLEKRITDRMEGAAESIGTPADAAVRAALLVAFDAAVRFDACRLLGEPMPTDREDPVEATLRTLLPAHVEPAAAMLAAAWRAALLAVAGGTTSAAVRTALEATLKG